MPDSVPDRLGDLSTALLPRVPGEAQRCNPARGSATPPVSRRGQRVCLGSVLAAVCIASCAGINRHWTAAPTTGGAGASSVSRAAPLSPALLAQKAEDTGKAGKPPTFLWLLTHTPVGIAFLFVCVLGWALAVLLVLLPYCGLGNWPNSYITDDATLEADRTCLQKTCTRTKVALRTFWAKMEYSKKKGPQTYYTAEDESPMPLPAEEAPAGTGLGTMRKWAFDQGRPPRTHAFWTPGDGLGLDMRVGPDHRRRRVKEASCGHLYECISVDVIRGDEKLDAILGHVMDVPPHHSSGDGALGWSSGCPLPRVICVNVQLPYRGMNPFGAHDAGCSIVSLFHITSETVHKIEEPIANQAPSLRLFRAFWEGEGGRLDNRLRRDQKATYTGGVFKAVALCSNLQECIHGMPGGESFESFNGKPALITKSGNLIKDPHGEWMEVSVDVRLFATTARVLLSSARDRVACASIHVGFLIQGISDDELPEGLIGDAVIHNVHIENHALQVPMHR